MLEFCPITWHERLPSTNTWLIEQVKARPDTPAGTVVAARSQTAGRGRQQRRWQAEPGRNLTFSFLWNAPLAREYTASMAQAISVGIARFLAGEGVPPTIKWPNDVLVGGRKISGILCEVANTGRQDHTAIVAGTGLNVNMTAEEAAAIDQPATSLALETGREWGVETVLEGLLEDLVAPLNAWASGGFAAIREDYAAFGPRPGTPLRVRDGDRHVAGAFGGFTDHGALRLALERGSERVIYSGDVLEDFGTE